MYSLFGWNKVVKEFASCFLGATYVIDPEPVTHNYFESIRLTHELFIRGISAFSRRLNGSVLYMLYLFEGSRRITPN